MLLLFPNFQEMTVVTLKKEVASGICLVEKEGTLYQNAVVGDAAAAVRPLRTHARRRRRLQMGVS